MNKQKIIKAIISELSKRLEILYKAAKSSHAEATHESSKAENKYDTRGLEASYLAEGQKRQADEIEKMIEDFNQLILPAEGSVQVSIGSLVKIEGKSQFHIYFVGPAAGGVDIEVDGVEIIVITPLSPLGKILIGKGKGDILKHPSRVNEKVKVLEIL
jgi:transcription elongation GreA/GreB family factor